MRILTADSTSAVGTAPVAMACPVCHQNGTFEGLPVGDVNFAGHGLQAGHRRCPNPTCYAHVFVVHRSGDLIEAYPPEVIDFDTTNVPPNVVAALEEAIICHANECYVAAAIMVRKALEELCADRGATGDTLKERITVLRGKVVLPQELLDGLDDLRLLGNDAAHIESKVYDKVGREEVEVGVEFTKEVLKAVYQMSDLLARLRGLQATREAEE
jgi:hypothetical protein